MVAGCENVNTYENKQTKKLTVNSTTHGLMEKALLGF